MDVDVAKELLNELGASLEELEKQQGAVVQFLKEKGIVSDDQLAPYLEQAGNASSVRWRATRVRLEHVFSTAAEREEKAARQREKRAEPQAQQPEGTTPESTRKAPGKEQRTVRTTAEEERSNREAKARDQEKQKEDGENGPPATGRKEGAA